MLYFTPLHKIVAKIETNINTVYDGQYKFPKQ